MNAKYSAVLTVIAMLITGCDATHRVAEKAFTNPVEVPAVDPSFQEGGSLLSGFDPPQDTVAWNSEDWVLLGVKASHGQEHDVWFVRLSTLPPHEDQPGGEAATRQFSLPFGVGPVKSGAKLTAPFSRVCVETYDRNGVFIRSSVRQVPQFAPTISLLDVCKLLRPGGSPSAPGLDSKPSSSSDATAGMMIMLRAVTCAVALEPIRASLRKDIVKLPTLVDVLLNGLRINLETDVTDINMVMSPWSIEAALAPSYQSKFPVCLAGQKLFDCRMIVGPTKPPYQLTGGVLLLEAVHPEKPENRVMIRVLAAKRIVK